MSATSAGAPHVVFDDVSVRYGARHAVREVSATVASGRVVALVGPNGSGKSTLLSLLTGHHPPYSGRVLIDGVDITRVRGADRAQHIGVLRQSSGPLPDVTVAELVALGPRPLEPRLVDEALARVDLTGLANEPVPTLSGGQLQRALLARAIRLRPRLLILDEPTNHLDVRHRLALLMLMRELGVTVICALHDLDLALRHADDMLLLSDGRLRAYGPASEVLTRERVRDVFGIDSEFVETSRDGTHLVLYP